MWEHELLNIKLDIVIISSDIERWENVLKKWSQIMYSNIFSYFIDSLLQMMKR